MPDTDKGPAKDPIAQAEEIVERDRAAQIDGTRLGRPSIFTCPDCGGTLWQMDEPELILFRCHVGHTLTGELLLAEQKEAAEDALWRTIRVLTDQRILAQELARFALSRGDEQAASTFESQARSAEQRNQTLRRFAESP